MCDYRVWFQSDEDVYVLQCSECNIFQARLRKAAFMFTIFEYKVFGEAISDIRNDISYKQNESHCIPAFNGGMRIMLDTEELEELYHFTYWMRPILK